MSLQRRWGWFVMCFKVSQLLGRMNIVYQLKILTNWFSFSVLIALIQSTLCRRSDFRCTYKDAESTTATWASSWGCVHSSMSRVCGLFLSFPSDRLIVKNRVDLTLCLCQNINASSDTEDSSVHDQSLSTVCRVLRNVTQFFNRGHKIVRS